MTDDQAPELVQPQRVVHPQRANRKPASEPAKPKPRKRTSQKRVTIFAFLYGAFAAGAVYFGVLFVTNLTTIAATGGDVIGSVARIPETIITGTTPVQREPRIEDRVTILLMGNDAREGEDRRFIRTDTMMLVTVDPLNKTAAMLSIPRDLWVPIPVGTGSSREVYNGRINEAYQLGYLRNYPGGGPALAVKTVEYNFGVPVNHWAMIDFEGFVKIVDTLGGIQIDVPSRIIDYEYPTDDYGYQTIRFDPGLQTLNGARALIYARTRHQDSDFGRTRRQQQVLMAIRDKALQLNMLPRLPQLAAQFSGAIQTDLSIPDAVRLASLLRDIPREEIQNRNLDGNAVVDSYVGGASVLIPQRAEIAKVVSELFYDPRIRQEAARVQVSNAAPAGRVAQSMADILRNNGWDGVSVINAESTADQTTIFDYSGKKHSAQKIAQLLGVNTNRIQEKRVPNSPVDIEVVIGTDARVPQAGR